MTATDPPARKPRKADFDAFWRAYLDAHRHPLTRACHYLATGIGLGSVLLALALLNPVPPLVGIPLGYALALGSHRWIEGKPSMIAVNVVYGARADLRMCRLALTGRIAGEYQRLGLGRPLPRPRTTERRRAGRAGNPALRTFDAGI